MKPEITITDEMVEIAARMLWIADGGLDGVPEDCERRWRETDRRIYAQGVRTALEAVAPMIARSAYERGQADMREKACGAAGRRVSEWTEEQIVWRRRGSAANSLRSKNKADAAEEIQADIRAIPTGGENG